MIEIAWRGIVTDAEIEALHGAAFGHAGTDDVPWNERMERHSLGWVIARLDGELVGFSNVVTDGGEHAWLQDVIVHPDRQRLGVGRDVVTLATAEASRAGCTWLHVDFDPEHREFYIDACGFQTSEAGLRDLR